VQNYNQSVQFFAAVTNFLAPNVGLAIFPAVASPNLKKGKSPGNEVVQWFVGLSVAGVYKI